MAEFTYYINRGDPCYVCGSERWEEERQLIMRDLDPFGNIIRKEMRFQKCCVCHNYNYLKEDKGMKTRQPGEGATIQFKEEMACGECKSTDTTVVEEDLDFRIDNAIITFCDVERLKCNECGTEQILDQDIIDLLNQADKSAVHHDALMAARKALLQTVAVEWGGDSVMGILARGWIMEMEEECYGEDS